MNMIPEPITENSLYEAQTQLLKVLTHPTRLAILNILREGEHCVCHMEAHLGLRQAYLSQQLAVLREAGLIQDRRDGWNVFYRVAEPRVFEVLNAVNQMVAPAAVPLATLATLATLTTPAPVACPCPKCNSSSGG